MGLPIPTIPVEIISVILFHLGKNDLLKCRLVSQSWNGLSLKILRNPKCGHEHELNNDYDIEKFLEFWKERNEEWVLPFHINCTEYGKSKHYPQFPNYIQQLQTIFGEECIVGLTLTHDSYFFSSSSSLESARVARIGLRLRYNASLESVEVLISILTLIAPSLTHLDLSQFKLTYVDAEENTKVTVKEMLGMTDLNFPNLSKLKSCPAPIDWHKEENVIHSFLIANSQNLRELEVISPYDLLDLRQQIRNLRKLKIVKPFALKGLDLDTVLEPIRASSPTVPVLKDLSLTYEYNTRIDDQILNEFLSSFSTSLQTITVRFEPIPRIPFPRLSQLRLLRIQIPSKYDRRHGNPTVLNLNSEAFPALESMDICTKIYFESTDSNSGNSKNDLSLPTVKNLIIRVTDSRSDSRATAKEYVDQLQQLFPNVTSLTLVNESDEHEEYLNRLLISFIQSDGAPKIKELEIQNCKDNYLGHFLSDFDPDRETRFIIENMRLDDKLLKAIKEAFQEFSGRSDMSVDKQMETRDGVENSVITCKAPIIHLKMTGLEKIRMSLLRTILRRKSEREREREPDQKDLFLMDLPKYFPLLKQIDISQQMFGVDKDFCNQQIINVQDKFPDLIININ